MSNISHSVEVVELSLSLFIPFMSVPLSMSSSGQQKHMSESVLLLFHLA